MGRSFFLAAAIALAASPALAEAPLYDGYGGASDFGGDCLGPNDDGSSSRIDLTEAFPGGLEFFGDTYTSVYVNTNGNITFRGPLGTFTPEAFPVAEQPMIAPYWADVDIRGTGCGFGEEDECLDPDINGVWWHLEPGLMIVTWDRVGYYACNDEHQMSFQLILTEAQYCGVAGDFDVEFRYAQCEWEVGEASGDESGNGLCDPGEDFCVPAQVGFDAGNLRDFVSVAGSRMDGIRDVVCDGSNVGIPGVYRFRIRGGAVECPDANEPCDTGGVGICAEGRTQCVGAATECRQVLTPVDEGCDGLDDDCDGQVDEGEGLCPETELCHRGRCIPPCFEGGCGEGEVCTDAGVCAEISCEEVECPAGERCIGGTCVSICDGVECPIGQSCRAGGCVDLCESVECDACHVCVEGSCLLHCVVIGCPTGEACEETGECVEESCLGVRCGPSRTCVGGRCLDTCDGVLCPMGEWCSEGECVPGVAPVPDAGPPEPDAGDPSVGRDSGPSAMPDGGVGIDGGSGGEDGGCGCRAARTDRSPIWLALVALALVLRRRGAR
jgi:MYXO-CTERM domain-containing protein